MLWFADGGGKADVFFDRQLIDWSMDTVVQVATGIMVDQVVDSGQIEATKDLLVGRPDAGDLVQRIGWRIPIICHKITAQE